MIMAFKPRHERCDCNETTVFQSTIRPMISLQYILIERGSCSASTCTIACRASRYKPCVCRPKRGKPRAQGVSAPKGSSTEVAGSASDSQAQEAAETEIRLHELRRA